MTRSLGGGDAAFLAVQRHRLPTDAHLEPPGHERPRLWIVAGGVLRISTATEVALLYPSCAKWVAARSGYELAAYGDVDVHILDWSPDLLAGRTLRPETIYVTALIRELVTYASRLGEQDTTKGRRVAELLLDLMDECKSGMAALKMPQSPEARGLARRFLQPSSFSTELPLLGQPLPVRTLQRRFPEETGLTIEGWRQSARIHHAIGRLAVGSSVARAAGEAGYANVTTFITAFRRETGLTPGRFLRR
jgi:hypothetical protein